jgi:hypothetical protein
MSVGADGHASRLLVLSDREVDIREADLLHRANVLHDCGDLCQVKEVEGNLRFIHEADGNFVLNSFSFSKDHAGRQDYYQ